MEFKAEPVEDKVSYEQVVVALCMYIGQGTRNIDALQASCILSTLFNVDKRDALQDVIAVREIQVKIRG